MHKAPLFERGERVVCVDARSFNGLISAPLIEGRDYVVKDLMQCVCGQVFVNVGIPAADDANTASLMCSRCFRRHRVDFWFVRQERFAPIDHISEVNSLLIEEVCHA